MSEKGTVDFRELLRRRLKDGDHTVFATVVYRSRTGATKFVKLLVRSPNGLCNITHLAAHLLHCSYDVKHGAITLLHCDEPEDFLTKLLGEVLGLDLRMELL